MKDTLDESIAILDPFKDSRSSKPAFTEGDSADPAKDITAAAVLSIGQKVLLQRAALRDKGSTGERSMQKAVEIFKAWTGIDLPVTDGWRFMIALKMAREIQGKFNLDDYVDLSSYSALLAEDEAKK